MKKGMNMILYAVALLASTAVFAGIDTGQNGGLVSATTGTIHFAANANLTNCLVKSTGGALTGSVTATNSAIALPPLEGSSEFSYFTTDGAVSFSGNTISLGNNQILNLNGGVSGMTITANGSQAAPSILEGFGQLQNTITVADNKQLNVRLLGELDANIALDCSTSGHTSILYLENDLHFSPGYGITATVAEGAVNMVNFSGGYSMYLGGSPSVGTTLANSHVWYAPSVHLTGPVTLANGQTISIQTGTYASLFGHGNTFTFGGSTAQLYAYSNTQPHLLDNVFLGSVYAQSLASAFVGTSWNLADVTFNSATGQSLQATGLFNSIGGYLDFFYSTGIVGSANSIITLNRDFSSGSYNHSWEVNGTSLTINGQGHSMSVYRDDSGNAQFVLRAGALILSDVMLAGVSQYTFNAASANTLYLTNVSWADAYGNSIFIRGALSNAMAVVLLSSDSGVAAGGLFSDANGIIWNSSVSMDLLTDTTLGGKWIFNGQLALNGTGRVFTFNGGSISSGIAQTVSFRNVTVNNASTPSLNLYEGSNLLLNNVEWIDNAGNSMRVNASPTSLYGDALVALPAPGESGNGSLFSENLTWTYGAAIELLSDVALSGTWTFEHNTVIEGHGCILNLGSGALTVAAGQTLTLRNMILDLVSPGSLVDPGEGGGYVNLCDVTIRLNGEDVNWGSLNTRLVVSGPTTIITESNQFTAPSGSTVNMVTLFYDTLSNIYTSNVFGFTFMNGARLQWIDNGSFVDTGDWTITASTVMPHYQFLSPTTETSTGRRLLFNNSEAAIIFDGEGKIVEFPSTNTDMDSQVCVQVAASTIVVTENIFLNGYKPAQVTLESSGETLGRLYFGDGTYVQLRSSLTGDDSLDQPLIFGSSSSATGETMTLDLAGATIDISNDAAAIVLQADTDSNSRLIIKNGTISGLAATKLSAPAGSTIVLENMNIRLFDEYTFVDASLTIVGNCVFSGGYNASFVHRSTGDFVIAAGATLTVTDDVTLSWECDSSNNLVFVDSSSTLALIGCTFRQADRSGSSLLLTNGVLTIDQQVILSPGSAGIKLGDATGESPTDLDLVIRPGAQCIVRSIDGFNSVGNLTYNMVTS